MHHYRPSIRRALPHTGDHIRGCTGPKIRRLNCSEEPTVKVSAFSAHSIPNARADSLLWLTSAAMPRQGSAWAFCIASAHAAQVNYTIQPSQCNFSGAPGADVGTASHRPSQQLISHGRSPNRTTSFLERTIPHHYIRNLFVPQDMVNVLPYLQCSASLSLFLISFKDGTLLQPTHIYPYACTHTNTHTHRHAHAHARAAA